MRTVLVLVGLLCGAFLPVLGAEASDVSVVHALAFGSRSTLVIVVHCAYGALAGWAVGALIAYLFGDR